MIGVFASPLIHRPTKADNNIIQCAVVTHEMTKIIHLSSMLSRSCTLTLAECVWMSVVNSNFLLYYCFCIITAKHCFSQRTMLTCVHCHCCSMHAKHFTILAIKKEISKALFSPSNTYNALYRSETHVAATQWLTFTLIQHGLSNALDSFIFQLTYS